MFETSLSNSWRITYFLAKLSMSCLHTALNISFTGLFRSSDTLRDPIIKLFWSIFVTTRQYIFHSGNCNIIHKHDIFVSKLDSRYVHSSVADGAGD